MDRDEDGGFGDEEGRDERGRAYRTAAEIKRS